ncbi:hypothetical protein PV433_16935 [Paenibacillus sp. GYB004]|uniref:hypothetical protein n=1 Tax=Paenibacillus sp. GYB004 TaxID=2994393 RepID=UPI002F96A5A5
MDRKMSRRVLLGSAGAAGAALIAGSLLTLDHADASGDDKIKTVSDIAELQSLTAAHEGQQIVTRGYYAAGDGGGAVYTVVSTSAYAGTPDQIIDFPLAASGKVAVMNVSGGIHMKQAGVQSGVDCTARVKAAYARNAAHYYYEGDLAPLIDCADPAYPAGKFGGGIQPPSNSYHWFDGLFKFQAKPNGLAEYVLFNLQGREHVTLVRPWIVGDVQTHTGTTGEWGFGYYISNGSKHITIIEGKAEKFWGDGYYIGNNSSASSLPIPEHITLQDCIADSNRRQGLSVTAVKQGRVVGGSYSRTGAILSTPPAYGIDIEPNAVASAYIDISLIDVQTSHNLRGGLQLVPGFLSGPAVADPFFNVYVENYRSFEDGPVGALRFAYPDLSNGGIRLNRKIFGQIVIRKATILHSKRKGVEWARWIPNAPEVVGTDISVIDPNMEGITNPASNGERSGFSINVTADDVSKGMTGPGAITLIRPQAIDRRTAPKLFAGFWIQTAAGASVSHLTVLDPHMHNGLAAHQGFLRVNQADSVTLQFAGVRPRFELDQSVTLTDGALAGVEIFLPASQTGTLDVHLPDAGKSLGLEYVVVNGSQAGGILNLVASGTNNLKENGLPGVTQLAVGPGDSYCLRALVPGVWSVGGL